MQPTPGRYEYVDVEGEFLIIGAYGLFSGWGYNVYKFVSEHDGKITFRKVNDINSWFTSEEAARLWARKQKEKSECTKK